MSIEFRRQIGVCEDMKRRENRGLLVFQKSKSMISLMTIWFKFAVWLVGDEYDGGDELVLFGDGFGPRDWFF